MVPPFNQLLRTSRALNRAVTALSYSAQFIASPHLFIPSIIFTFIHFSNLLISSEWIEGNRFTYLHTANSLNLLLSIPLISLGLLFTMERVNLSQRIGTVASPLKLGSAILYNSNTVLHPYKWSTVSARPSTL